MEARSAAAPGVSLVDWLAAPAPSRIPRVDLLVPATGDRRAERCRGSGASMSGTAPRTCGPHQPLCLHHREMAAHPELCHGYRSYAAAPTHAAVHAGPGVGHVREAPGADFDVFGASASDL